MERAERSLSPMKKLQPSLTREATWLDIYKVKPELEAQVRALTGAKDTMGAVRVFQDLYKMLSWEIHNPDAVTVPIPLGRLSFATAALVVLLCRNAPMKYHILSENNEDLGSNFTPEQVKAGKVWGEGAEEGGRKSSG